MSTRLKPARSHVIWTNSPTNDEATQALRDGTRGHRLILQSAESVRDASGAPPADADILFGQPALEALRGDSTVRWVHLTSAGYTRYDRADVREFFRTGGAVLTNSSHVFDDPCAQHLAAMILGLSRRLPACLDNQRVGRDWFHDDLADLRYRLINGQCIFIYGFGAIARRLVELLAPWKLQIFGVRRHPRGDEPVPMLSEAQADARLGEADHVVDILPHNDSTAAYFDADRFARCRRGARFYNIGRGATVDQTALVTALRDGRLDVAYLDVTDPEPLPAEHELWTVPNCHITPHIAGRHFGEEVRLVRHFLANLQRFEVGEPLLNRVF